MWKKWGETWTKDCWNLMPSVECLHLRCFGSTIATICLRYFGDLSFSFTLGVYGVHFFFMISGIVIFLTLGRCTDVSRFLWTFGAASQVAKLISNSDQSITTPLTQPSPRKERAAPTRDGNRRSCAAGSGRRPPARRAA